MNTKEESSKIIQPLYQGDLPPQTTTNYVPLSVFDKATFDAHIAIIYAYRPPNPLNLTLEIGLRKALSVYREFAGRLSRDGEGEPIILLNDAGVRFVEATVDIKLDEIMPLKPSSISSSFHPSTYGVVEELVQVQITKFTCGSIVIGFTFHHRVADGHATSNFLVAWGKACRGLDIHPLPLCDRNIFKPRDPPRIEYEHKGVEFESRKKLEKFSRDEVAEEGARATGFHPIHFSKGFLAEIKAKASYGNNNGKPYTMVESLVAHLWRTLTKARGLNSYQTVHVKIAVNGRMRLSPRIVDEYFGNLVLWAIRGAKVEELLEEPLPYAAKLIHDAISEVNEEYFRSFIDFATHKVKEENLVPTADLHVQWPNLDVFSWLRFPFGEVDFGGGSPCVFMPSYTPVVGVILLLPSFLGDGSIDAYISLSQNEFTAFHQICHQLD